MALTRLKNIPSESAIPKRSRKFPNSISLWFSSHAILGLDCRIRAASMQPPGTVSPGNWSDNKKEYAMMSGMPPAVHQPGKQTRQAKPRMRIRINRKRIVYIEEYNQSVRCRKLGTYYYRLLITCNLCAPLYLNSSSPLLPFFLIRLTFTYKLCSSHVDIERCAIS